MPGAKETKTKAISYIMLETDRGRRAVENMMDELERQGRIHFSPDPADKRLQWISREDIDLIIRVLKGEDTP